MSTDTTTPGPFDAVLSEVIRGQRPKAIDSADGLYEVQDDAGHVQIINPERFGDIPRRTRGTVTHTTVDSWLSYWNSHGRSAAEIWADLDARTVTAIFDAPEAGTPRWAQHRSVLKLQHSPEWQDWMKISGEYFAQIPFAEFVEDHSRDISEPDSVTMLELVQTFEATTSARFESGHRLDNGDRRLNYVTDTTATAGKNNLTIPDHLTLALRPFMGSDRWSITARFRYRLGGGNLALGIKLDRPENVIEDALNDIVDKIYEATDHTVMHGRRPDTALPAAVTTAQDYQSDKP